MKFSALIVLTLIVALQSINALPQRRTRRDAVPDLHLSPEATTKREMLMDSLIEEMISLAKSTIEINKDIFEKVVKHAEESDLKSDALKEQLKKFTDLINRAKSMPEPKTAKDVKEFLELSLACNEITDKYDELVNPTEEEKLIKRLLDENGGKDIPLKFFALSIKLQALYELNIESYINSLSEEDKVKDAKFLEWFKEFKKEKGLDKIAGAFHFIDEAIAMKKN